jgi:PEP-CTERM motif
MLKQTILALSLGCCSVAHAEYNYQAVIATYTGFADLETGVFNPHRTETMRALVRDVNGDGNFTLDEVRNFAFHTVNIEVWQIQNFGLCGRGGGESWCISDFNYSSDNSLTFQANEYGSYSGYSWGDVASSGNRAYYWFSSMNGYSASGILWTPETTVSITVTPAVPEPSTYAMLGAGLCAIGAVARRRRRQ